MAPSRPRPSLSPEANPLGSPLPTSTGTESPTSPSPISSPEASRCCSTPLPSGDKGRRSHKCDRGTQECVRHNYSTVKLASLVDLEPGLVTVTGPVVAPRGTVAQT